MENKNAICPQCGKDTLTLLRRNFFTSRKSYYCTSCKYNGELPLKTSTKLVCWTVTILVFVICIGFLYGDNGRIGLFGIIAPIMLFLDWKKRNSIQKYWIENKLTPPAPIHEKYGVFKGLLYSVLIIFFFCLVSYFANYNNPNTTYTTSSAKEQPTSELIRDMVADLKKQMTLPSKIDENTTLINVTSGLSSVRYHYVLSGLDTNEISEVYIRTFLKPNICKNQELINLMNKGVNLEYDYTVSENSTNYFVVFTKGDCL